MAVSEVEVRNLQAGDQIVIISEKEARDREYWYGREPGWAGSPRGAAEGMNHYCGKTLTVTRVDNGGYVFVEEVCYWWKSDFIAAVIHTGDDIKPLADEAIEVMLFGG